MCFAQKRQTEVLLVSVVSPIQGDYVIYTSCFLLRFASQMPKVSNCAFALFLSHPGVFTEYIDCPFALIEHRTYVHQKYIRLLVTDIYAKRKVRCQRPQRPPPPASAAPANFTQKGVHEASGLNGPLLFSSKMVGRRSGLGLRWPPFCVKFAGMAEAGGAWALRPAITVTNRLENCHINQCGLIDLVKSSTSLASTFRTVLGEGN